MNPTPLKQMLLDHATSTYEITGKLFHRLSDDDLSWSPPLGNNWMTTGQLLMHCASFGCGKAVQGFVTGDWKAAGLGDDSGGTNGADIPPPELLPSVGSVAEALKFLRADRELAFRCIQGTDESDLLSKQTLAPWGGPPQILFRQLMLMIDHLAQHKGQLFYYLKLMGKDVNTGDLWGA